ncbi:MAG TPA: site-2 protease family protein [Chlamydiales bacterium]|nr:site-2 protease family protein [Chlamydiales bacterium]
MAVSLIYALFAILGLGFLVFIHELGHYWIARRQGMRVEVFAIGFGKAIYSWEWDGVKWQICALPFGGYVKIAGMQKEGGREPSEIPDGFYGKRPWQRIQVALAGPVVNIAFALVAFAILWTSGGRNKQFSEFTHRIGWVDPKSALYERGVRPGDVIEKYDGHTFNGFKDLLMAGVMSDKTTEIQGYTVDYLTGQRNDFHYTLPTYDDPRMVRDKIGTIGIVSPASYLIYTEGLPTGSPMMGSGIQPNDRILWADGEVVFSAPQLSALINESTAILTVQRGNETFQTKVPRIQIDDLKMSAYEKGEIDDWQHEAGIRGRIQDLYFIPYNLSPNASVESRLEFIDEEDQTKAFKRCERCAYFNPLQEGDQILAVDGQTIRSSYEFLERLQSRHALVIVERNPEAIQKVLWTQADPQFDQFNISNLEAIVSSIGTDEPVTSSGSLHLLSPVVPKPFNDLSLSSEQKAQFVQEIAQNKKEIEAIQDPQKRIEALDALEKNQRRVILGIPLKDRDVFYNPTPAQQFVDVFKDTYRTLFGLVSGYLNPKYVSGPVGIVQVVHHSWMVGGKEALYWMAVISLNLGLINLLPIPVLDGGHIVFSLIEMITKRPIRAKTMERLIIPFVGLLIALFIYITYQDISRLFGKFF